MKEKGINALLRDRETVHEITELDRKIKLVEEDGKLSFSSKNKIIERYRKLQNIMARNYKIRFLTDKEVQTGAR